MILQNKATVFIDNVLRRPKAHRTPLWNQWLSILFSQRLYSSMTFLDAGSYPNELFGSFYHVMQISY